VSSPPHPFAPLPPKYVLAGCCRYLLLLAKAGFLVQIESLLSTVGKENAMIEDMLAAVRTAAFAQSCVSLKAGGGGGAIVVSVVGEEDCYSGTPSVHPSA
jgi:hypothetical protein